MSDMVMAVVEEVDQIKVLTDRMEQEGEEEGEEGEEVEGKITITVHLKHSIQSMMTEFLIILTIQPRRLDVRRK